ncbi:MAG: UDP-N-acetylglucosamine 2-epimerase (non-hydrolyzing) [Marinilabilia sp.]
MQKIILVAGARPNFVKIAPLWRVFSQREGVQVIVVHTGQHYDDNMNGVFFEDLGLPRPDYNLNAGGQTHARQTADIMARFDEVLDREQPHDVVVVGDVNSTMACSLVAVKRGIRVSHVEAGLRSFDRSMPEEINRLVTDAVAGLLFVSEPSGMDNLRRENVPDEKVWLVGNVMIDSLVYAREKIDDSDVLERFGLADKGFALVTMHRPSNVDAPERLGAIMSWLRNLSNRIPVVFPMHPRTLKQLESSGLPGFSDPLAHPALNIISPQGYIDFQRLLRSAQFVLTDSGGLQEETTWLGVPCITLRNNTERPVTVEQGTNCLVGEDINKADEMVRQYLAGKCENSHVPELWDGHTAQRIADVIIRGAFHGENHGRT